MDAETWPVVLLGLRVGAVVLLYLFLMTAFRALRADLRGAVAPERATPRTTAALPEEGWATSAATTAGAWDDEWDGDGEDWAEDVIETPRRPAPPVPSSGPRLRLWLPIAAAVLLAGFGGAAFLLDDIDPGAPPASAPDAEATTVNPLEPPTVAPPAGRVTVGLATLEDAQVRVTVDGVVEFDGTLRRGQRQAWDAAERIQVATDNGKQVQLAVNGVDLGAYSPAMGHPDWNRIDFGFWPGWAQ